MNAGGGATAEQLDGIGELQRLELDQGFSGDVERDLARTQDPQAAGNVEQLHRERCRGVDDVLAVVENQDAGRELQSLEQRGLAAGDGQRRYDHVEYLLCGRGSLEADQPDAS
jgi:hypothetical protein